MSDDKTRTDLTRLEDISAFLHEEDDEVNSKLETYSDPNKSETTEEEDSLLPSLDDLEEEENEEDKEQEIPSLPEDEEITFDSQEDNEATLPAFELSEEEDEEEFSDFSSFGEDQDEEENIFEGTNFDLTTDEFNEEVQEEEPEEKVEEELEEIQEEQNNDGQNEEYSLQEEIENEQQTPPTASLPKEASTPQRENFQDLRRFSENITYGNVALGGNPPFSIVLKKIKYHEDGESIISILEEHGLINDQNRQVMSMSIEHGTLLLSQLSEYAAIYLCHKLRRFNLEMMMGLSEEIRPSKSYENEEKGLISKSNLKQNKSSHHEFKQSDIKQEDIILSLNSNLDGMQVMRYIDIISSHKVAFEYEIRHNSNEDEQENDENYQLDQSEIFNQLKEQLRAKAFSLRANAVIGINFQLTPISEGENREFKITCTGNAVWLIDAPGAKN